MKYDHIYRVSFQKQPIAEDPRCDFFFTSLAAIYDLFAPEQIGCKVTNLWNVGVSDGVSYDGKLCCISREPLYRKKRTGEP